MNEKEYFRQWYLKHRAMLLQQRKRRYAMDKEYKKRIRMNSSLQKRFKAWSDCVVDGKIYLNWKDFQPLLGRWRTAELRRRFPRRPTLDEYIMIYRLNPEHNPLTLPQLERLLKEGRYAEEKEK